MRTTPFLAAAALIVASILAAHVTLAQAPGIKRTDILRHDLGIPGREVIEVRVDFAPGLEFGRHSHPLAGHPGARVQAPSRRYWQAGSQPFGLSGRALAEFSSAAPLLLTRKLLPKP